MCAEQSPWYSLPHRFCCSRRELHAIAVKGEIKILSCIYDYITSIEELLSFQLGKVVGDMPAHLRDG